MDEDQLTEQLTTAQEQLKQLQNRIPSEEEFTDIAPDEHLTQQIAQQMLTVRYLTVSHPLLHHISHLVILYRIL